MSTTVQDIFKVLSTDNKVISSLEASLDNIMKDGVINQYDIPELIFMISTLLNSTNKLKLSSDNYNVLIKMLYNFIINKYNLIPEINRPDFERLTDMAIRLVLLQPKITKTFNNIFSCCSTKNVVESVEKIDSVKIDSVKIDNIKIDSVKIDSVKIDNIMDAAIVNNNTTEETTTKAEDNTIITLNIPSE
jgi:hypothetical protein